MARKKNTQKKVEEKKESLKLFIATEDGVVDNAVNEVESLFKNSYYYGRSIEELKREIVGELHADEVLLAYEVKVEIKSLGKGKVVHGFVFDDEKEG